MMNAAQVEHVTRELIESRLAPRIESLYARAFVDASGEAAWRVEATMAKPLTPETAQARAEVLTELQRKLGEMDETRFAYIYFTSPAEEAERAALGAEA